MAHEVVMPQLGLSMDSGEIIRWLKQSGDAVQPGDLLLEVESDKSTVEVEAVAGGILHITRTPEDGMVPVGDVIAYLLTEGEQAPQIGIPTRAAAPPPEPAQASITTPLAASPQPGANGKSVYPRANRPPSSPAARRRAEELGVDWRQAKATGRGGRIKERDVVALAGSLTATAPTPATAEAVQISPVARRMAESMGVDVVELARQHPGKRLEREDVEETLRRAMQGPAAVEVTAPTLPAVPVSGTLPAQRSPITSLRRRIAERMAQSARSNATVTLTTEADATELARIRETLKADAGIATVPSYNVLFAALVARALREFPYMNASLDGDEVVAWGTVNIGIAVDTARGLVVPIVRDVHTKNLSVLAAEMSDLLVRASEGKALPDELIGSTFTITNLGAYEIDAFTPIINPPECAVLGVGRLVEKVVPFGGQPAIRTMVALSLTFDHRLVDGAPAARFLQRVKQFVEQPYRWLG